MISGGLTGGLGVGTSGGALGTLFVRLAADSSSLVQGTAQGSKAVKLFGAAVAGALAAVSAAAVNEFAKFDKAMNSAFAIMGDVSNDIRKQMADNARQIARDGVKSAEDMGKSYMFLASAGFDAQQAMKALPLLARFATAGNFEMAKATDLLADSQSALGLRTADATKNLENMTRVSDTLTKANILSNASVEQFAEALTNKAAAALRMVNKDVEEGVAVLAAYADQGLKGEAAGEALNIVLRDLQTAAIGNRKVFDELGIEVFDSSGAMNNMADIVGQLESALGSASTEQKRMVLQLLGFQDRSVSALNALVGVSGKIRDYEKALRSAGGLTEEVANKQMESFSAKLENTVNIIKDLLITIGEGLAPSIELLNNMLKESTALNTANNESWKETARIFGTVMVGAVKGAIMIWEGWRDLLKVVAISMLNIAEIQLSHWLPTFKLLSNVFEGFVHLVADGVNLLVDKVNSLVDKMPTKVKEMLGIERLSNVEVDFQLPLDSDKIEEWITTLRLAREELQNGLVKTIVDAPKQVEPAIETVEVAFSNMAATMGKDIGVVEAKVNKVKQMLDSASANAQLDEIGLPDEFGGTGTFDAGLGVTMEAQKEIEAAEMKLFLLEDIAEQELELNEATQRRKLEAIEAYNKQLHNLQMAQTQIILQASQNAFDEMANAARAWAGEQSEVYKAMFAASKAFAIAESIIKIQQGIASAAALPFPANLAAIASVVAATASIVSTISQVTFQADGKRAVGGGVRGGGTYLVGERGPELFSPASNGTISPNNRIGGGDVKVVVNNYSDATATVSERTDGDQRVVEVAIRRVKTEIAGEIRDGRGEMSRAMETSYGLRRGKGNNK